MVADRIRRLGWIALEVALEVRPVVGAVAIGVDGQRGLQLGEPLERRGR